MNVRINTSATDQGTDHIAPRVRAGFAALGAALSGDYGGPMQHLWIDLQLSPAAADRRPVATFRLQKRVVTPRELRAFGTEEFFEVGHYQVRPDYDELARVPLDEIACYLMRRVYDSTAELAGKRQLRGFDLPRFRQRFAAVLLAQGCTPGR